MSFPAPSVPDSPSVSVPRISIWRSLVVALLGAGTIYACLQQQDLNQVAESGVVMTLPPTSDDFIGQDAEITTAEKTILPKDTEFARKTYKNSQGDQFMASIVLSGGEKRSIHRPEICLPGQGWTVTSGETIPIVLQTGRTLPVMKLTLSRQVETGPKQTTTVRAIYLYWFVGLDRTTPSHLERTIATSWDRVVHKVNHRWAYVIVTATIMDNLKPGGKNEEETLAMLKSYISKSVPSFQKSEMLAVKGTPETQLVGEESPSSF